MIQKIHQLSCARVGWIAKYICYRASDPIRFGKTQTTVGAFCKEWEAFDASLFEIRAWAGPPNKPNWYKLTLASYVVDWYFNALLQNHRRMIDSLEKMLLEEPDETR